MLETLQGDLGCNRRVDGAFRSQICEVEFGYISPHNSTIVEAILYP